MEEFREVSLLKMVTWQSGIFVDFLHIYIYIINASHSLLRKRQCLTEFSWLFLSKIKHVQTFHSTWCCAHFVVTDVGSILHLGEGRQY